MKIITTKNTRHLVPLSAVPSFTCIRWEEKLYFKGSTAQNAVVGLERGADWLAANADTEVEIVDAELVVNS